MNGSQPLMAFGVAFQVPVVGVWVHMNCVASVNFARFVFTSLWEHLLRGFPCPTGRDVSIHAGNTNVAAI